MPTERSCQDPGKITLLDKDQWVGVEIIQIQELLGPKMTQYAIQKLLDLLLAIHEKKRSKILKYYAELLVSRTSNGMSEVL